MPKLAYDPSSYGPRRVLARPPTSGVRYGRWSSAGLGWGRPPKSLAQLPLDRFDAREA